MFSGKTSELNREFKKYRAIDLKVTYINYADDTRYGSDDYVYSHNGEKIKCIKESKLSNVKDDIIKDNDVIMINEGQFFTDLVEYCSKWTDQYNKHVIVCALDGDYLRKPFNTISQLIPLSDNITKMKAYCKLCKNGTYALFSWRVGDSAEQIVINNDYLPVCRKHYLQLLSRTPPNGATADLSIAK